MEKIQVNMVFEILGRPKDNVENAMKSVIGQMSSDKGVKLIEKKIHEAVPLEKSDLFTTFSEVFLEFDSIENLLQIVFKYMPSNIEIIKPEKIILKNNEFNSIVNTLTQKMHKYDAIVKNTLMQRDMLARKLKEVAPHLFVKKGQEELKEENNTEGKKQKKDNLKKNNKKTKKK
jgi:hypothetical protein